LTENDESFIHLYGLMMTPFRFSWVIVLMGDKYIFGIRLNWAVLLYTWISYFFNILRRRSMKLSSPSCKHS
jgi:hypothetical protein